MTTGKKCIVHGCSNRAAEGGFVNGLCRPCFEMLTTGEVGLGQTFIHDMCRALADLRSKISDIRMTVGDRR